MDHNELEVLMQISKHLEDIKKEQALQTNILDALVRFAADFHSQYPADRHHAVLDALNRIYAKQEDQRRS